MFLATGSHATAVSGQGSEGLQSEAGMAQMGGLMGLHKKSHEIWFLACEFDQLLSPTDEKQVQFRIQNVQDLQEGGLQCCMHLTVLGRVIFVYNCVGTQ